MILHIIGIIVIGLIVGAIARLLVPGKHHMGWIATALLGIAGAYVGGTLGNLIFQHEFMISPPLKHSFLGALVGAVVLLLVYRLFTGRTRT